MKFRKSSFVFGMFALLAGCSTVPIEAPKVAGPAIVFVRDTGALGSMCTFDVLIDGAVVGQLEGGRSLVRTVEPGKHRVGVNNVTGICPNIRSTKVVEVESAPVVLRFGFVSSGSFIFDQVE